MLWGAIGKRWSAAMVALVVIATGLATNARAQEPRFDAVYVAQTPFDVVGSGTVATIAVTFRNTGQRAWVRGTDSEVVLAVCGTDKVTCGIASPHADWAAGWASTTTYALQQTEWVLPGEVGLFRFSVRAPAGVAPGTRIRLHGELVLASTGQAVRPSGFYHDVATPYQVRVSADATAIAPGDSAQFRARANDASGRRLPGARTVWSVVGPGEIDPFGVLTILPDAAGTVRVVARSGDAFADVTVMILAPPPGSIEISPRVASLTAGTSTKLRATVRDVTGSIVQTRRVVWTATGAGSISADGTFIAGIGPGAAVVTARLGDVTGSTTISVRAHAPLRTPSPPPGAPPPSSPTPAPTASPVAAPTATPSPAPIATSTPAPAQLPSPTPAPTPAPTESATPPPSATPSATPTPASSAIPTPTAAPTPTGSPSPSPTQVASPSPAPSSPSPTPSPSATPSPAPTPPPAVGEVIVTPLLATIDPGDTETFTAVVLDLFGQVLADAAVTWSATGAGTIDATGTFRAGDDAAGGTATVTATSGGVLGTASVVIEPRVPTRVVISPQTATISPGDVVVFGAKVFDQSGKQLSTATVRWSVSGAGSIDASGRYTAPSDPLGGVAQITATSGTATASATVTIEPDPPADPDTLPGL